MGSKGTSKQIRHCISLAICSSANFSTGIDSEPFTSKYECSNASVALFSSSSSVVDLPSCNFDVLC